MEIDLKQDCVGIGVICLPSPMITGNVMWYARLIHNVK